jgi:hypothetical protein
MGYVKISIWMLLESCIILSSGGLNVGRSFEMTEIERIFLIGWEGF